MNGIECELNHTNLTIHKTSKFSVFSVFPTSLSVEELFNVICNNITWEIAAELSKAERKNENNRTHSLIYGEIPFTSMEVIFKTLKTLNLLPDNGGVFYDLGSGSGRSTIQGALLHNFESCKGIEIMSSLYELSLKLKCSYDKCNKFDLLYKPRLEFIRGSILDKHIYDWTDGDVIFINSTCFDDDMFIKIGKFGIFKPTCCIITLSVPLASELFSVREELRLQMSWGSADVFIHQPISS